MRRSWNKYRDKNFPGHSDCMIVTAMNAYYYLTGKVVSDKNYERFRKMTATHTGSAIGIAKVWKELGLKCLGEYSHIFNFTTKTLKRKGTVPFITSSNTKIPLPLEVNVFHPRTGLHSVLIVDHCTKSNAYRVTNFRYETTTAGWIFEERLNHMFADPMRTGDFGKEMWAYRLWGLKGMIKVKG